MLFDAHTHAYNLEEIRLVEERAAGLDSSVPDEDPKKWILRNNGSIESLLLEEHRAGVDRFVLLPVSGREDRVSELNKWSTALAADHPAIIPFGTLIASSGSLERDLEEALELGVRGIKVHPAMQRLDILSREAHRMWDMLEEAGLPVVLDSMYVQGISRYKPHISEFIEAIRPFEAGPERIAEVAGAHPQLVLVAAHCGSLFGWDVLDPLYDLENVYFDMSFTSGILPDEEVVEIIHRKGTPHVLFGTDAPWRNPTQEKRWFEGLPLDRESRDAIAWKNLEGILGHKRS